jgi:hypothetical protein
VFVDCATVLVAAALAALGFDDVLEDEPPHAVSQPQASSRIGKATVAVGLRRDLLR